MQDKPTDHQNCLTTLSGHFIVLHVHLIIQYTPITTRCEGSKRPYRDISESCTGTIFKMTAYSIIAHCNVLHVYRRFLSFSYLNHLFLRYITAYNTFQQTKYVLFLPLVNNYGFFLLYYSRDSGR